MAAKGTVLVTGGSGYIGGWCVIGLLQQGYKVRTTVRDLAKGPAVRAALGKAADVSGLEFHAADLMADAGWDSAVEGCDYVLHVASPLGVTDPKDPDVLIRPAREGARRAVGAAIRAGVKRVVLTSSVAAASPVEAKVDFLADETVWTDPAAQGVSVYAQSKTLAERAAWDLIGEAGGKTTLATVNPTLVLGPVLSGDFSDSVQVVERLVAGRIPGLPRIGFNVVDVRDVADLHIRAMTAPEAAGQRLIAAGGFVWMADMAALLRAELGTAGARIPTRKAPDLLLRLASLVDTDLKFVVPRLGRRYDFTSKKAQDLLGWRPRPTDQTVLDCARSLIETGVA